MNWCNDLDLDEEFKHTVLKLKEMPDASLRHKFALAWIEYGAAYMEPEKHSKYALIMAQYALCPELLK